MSNNNAAWGFKSNVGFGAQYASIFTDLNFEQPQFKMQEYNAVPIEQNNKDVVAACNMSVVPADLKMLQKQFDDEESAFDKECEVIKDKAAGFEAKLVELCREIDVCELVGDSKQVALEELNGDGDDHTAQFEQCCEVLSEIKAEIIPSQFMETELEQEMDRTLECYDSSYSILRASKEENSKISDFTVNYEADYEQESNVCNKLENILLNVQQKLERLPSLEETQVDLEGMSFFFEAMHTEMTSFRQQIAVILNVLLDDFHQSKQRTEEAVKELQEREKVLENLKNKRATLRSFYHECVQKTENLFLQRRIADEVFEKAAEESQRKIEELKKQCEEKGKIFEESTKKMGDTTEALEKLILNHSKLEKEELNMDISSMKLKEKLQQMDAEEAKLNGRQTEIKIQMAVERTLQEQLEDSKHQHENKVAQLQSLNHDLGNEIERKRSSIEEKKKALLAVEEKQRIEFAELQEEYRKTKEAHDQMFKDGIPPELQHFFGANFAAKQT